MRPLGMVDKSGIDSARLHIGSGNDARVSLLPGIGSAAESGTASGCELAKRDRVAPRAKCTPRRVAVRLHGQSWSARPGRGPWGPVRVPIVVKKVNEAHARWQDRTLRDILNGPDVP